jgi:hypothetical protein
VLGCAGVRDDEEDCSIDNPEERATVDPGSSACSIGKPPIEAVSAEDPETPAPGSTCGADGNSRPSTNGTGDAGGRVGGGRAS